MADTKKSPSAADKPQGKSKVSKAKKASKSVVTAEQGEAKAAKPASPKGSSPARRNPLMPKTPFAAPGTLDSAWRLIDASNVPLGRLSSYIAKLLMGKTKAGYTRFCDTGDHVVVINAEKVKLTGNKLMDKTYHYHTNYPGGIKTFTAQELLSKYPERLVEWAVYGMLPKGHMGRRWYKKLLVYAGTTHPHTAQKPEVTELPDLGTWQ